MKDNKKESHWESPNYYPKDRTLVAYNFNKHMLQRLKCDTGGPDIEYPYLY